MEQQHLDLIKITDLLSDCQHHSESNIAAQLNIPEAAVEKSIKKLKEYGIDIQCEKNGFLKFEKPLILLNEKKILSELKHQSVELTVLEKVNSTQDIVKIKKYSQKIFFCFAETQTQGRGQFDRQWHSPFGQNIYLSMRYPFEKKIDALSGLSLIIALSIIQAIKSVIPIENIKVKWPNDIFYKDQKISGILVDIESQTNKSCDVIIGIGINVNMQNANTDQINQSWSSLQKIYGSYIDRNALCSILIDSLLNYLNRFSMNGLSDFADEWNQCDYLYQKSIQLQSGSKQFSGIASGINSQGHLLLTLDNQIVHAFPSGETYIVDRNKKP